MDVVQYYTEEAARLEREVARLTEESLHSPLGIAFVTFDNINSSKRVYDDHKSSYLSCFKSFPQESSLSVSLKADKWKVSFASTPRDIKWTNLRESQHSHYLKIFLVNVMLILIGIFFTTPEFIASQINVIIDAVLQSNDQIKIPSWMLSYFPTIILMLFTMLMPSVIAWSVRYLGHSYKSTENYLVLRNTFWYLWAVVIIFPTFGLTTVENLLTTLIDSNGTTVGVEWECFFSPDTSAFYVSYVISAALVGTGLELVRISEAAL